MKILYIEQQARDYPLTHMICERFPNAEKVYINHYKNLFDKKTPYSSEKVLLIAKQTGNILLPVPESYGYGTHAFFLRTALNCLFDCEYCYLKGAFRNDFPVIFSNTEEIQQQVKSEIDTYRQFGYTDTIRIYPSNWTDLLASETIAHFHQQYLPFFETLDNVMIESRTKSSYIDPLLAITEQGILQSPPINTEIAYSLNPQKIINDFERGTPPLKKRIEAINILLKKGRKVGIRIIPLLPVPECESIYVPFFEQLKSSISMDEINSLFFGGFLLTSKDFKKMKRKNPTSTLRDMLIDKDDEKGLLRTAQAERKKLYALILKYFPQAHISFDEL